MASEGEAGRRPGWVLLAVAGTVLAVALGCLVRPVGDPWFFGDDFTYLRWVLEHVGRAEDAFGAVVFKHVRPATLLAWMAGTELSGGGWWGPYVVHATGVVLAVLGAGAWAWTLSGRVWTGWLAALLVVGDAGTAEVLGWCSWLNTGWETAATCWGLALATHALRRERWGAMVLAVLLLGCAGLFKEHGWLAGPAAVVATVLWLGRNRRRVAMACVAGAVGCSGFAWTFHAENLARYQRGAAEPWTRLVEAVGEYGGMLLSSWPLGEGGQGLPLLLLAGAVLGVVAGRGAGRMLPPVTALAVHAAITLPAPMKPHVGHAWGAGVVLAVLTAVGLQGLWRERGSVLGPALFGLLAMSALVRLPAALDRAEPVTARRASLDRRSLLAAATLARAVEARSSCQIEARAAAPLAILPLWGVHLGVSRPVGGHSVLIGSDLVLYGTRAPRFSQPIELYAGEPAVRLKLQPGSYALVLRLSPGQSWSWPLTLRSGCGVEPVPRNPVALREGGWAALPFDVEAGCEAFTVQLDRSAPASIAGGVTRLDLSPPRLPDEPVAPQRRMRCAEGG